MEVKVEYLLVKLAKMIILTSLALLQYQEKESFIRIQSSLCLWHLPWQQYREQ